MVFHAHDGLSAAVQLSFAQGLCLSYGEHFEANTSGQRSYYCPLGLVARTIRLGDVVFDNHWPVQVP